MEDLPAMPDAPIRDGPICDGSIIEVAVENGIYVSNFMIGAKVFN